MALPCRLSTRPVRQGRGTQFEPERAGKDEAGHGVRGVQLAVEHLVADGRPADLAAQLHLQPVLLQRARVPAP